MATDLEIKSVEDPETYARLTTLRRRGQSFLFPNAAIEKPPQSLENDEQLSAFRAGVFEKYKQISEDDFGKLSAKDKTRFYQALRFTTRKLDGMSTFNLLLLELSFFPKNIDDLTNTIYATQTDVVVSPAFNKKFLMTEKTAFITKYLAFLDAFVTSARFRNKRELGICLPINNVTVDDFKKILAKLKKYEIRFVVADFQGTGPFQETRIEKMHSLNRLLGDQFPNQYFIYGANIRYPAHGTGLQKIIPAEDMFSVGLGIDAIGNNHIQNFNPEATKVNLKKLSSDRDLKILSPENYLYDFKKQNALEQDYPELTVSVSPTARQKLVNAYLKLKEEKKVRGVLKENKGVKSYLSAKRGYSKKYKFSK